MCWQHPASVGGVRFSAVRPRWLYPATPRPAGQFRRARIRPGILRRSPVGNDGAEFPATVMRRHEGADAAAAPAPHAREQSEYGAGRLLRMPLYMPPEVEEKSGRRRTGNTLAS